MNYYNEWDPQAAAWLRELIQNKLIPDGDVDTRSITDVKPEELQKYTQCHFFAGIGGWARAFQLAGFPADRPAWTGSCPCQPFSAAGRKKGVNDERHLWPIFARLIAQCRPPVVFGEQVPSAIGHQWLDGVCADMEKEGYAVGAVVLGACAVGAPHRRQRLYWVAENTLADTNHIGRQPRYGKEGGERGEVWFRSGVEFGNCGKNCSLADMQQQGLEGHARDVHDRNESRRERTQTTGPVTKSGNSICMGNARSGRLHGNHGGRTGEEFTHRHTWDDVRIVHCRDGKCRRIPVESSICWMVDGLPQGVDIDWVRRAIETSFPVCKTKTYKNTRTDLLRGYGNAIVPHVAAEFVAAWMEVHQ